MGAAETRVAAEPGVKPRFFATAAAFRAWLARHHARAPMLLVGFHRVGAGKGTLTYPQALDEALCFGWIDGLRRGLDAASYSIRFSPRRTGSIWSAVNLRHVARLEREGCMTAAGRAAFQARDPAKTLRYSFEVGRLELAPGFATRLAADRRARAHFDAMPPSYRRPAIHWIMTAKREATRARRFATLLACSRRGARIPPLDYPKRPERRPARSTRAASGIPASARKAAARRRLNPGKG